MKTVTKFKTFMFVAACILTITSCEKPTVDAEILNIKEQEGFMSTTGNSDATVADDQSEAIQPIFHMHFGPEVSKEEALSKFDKATAKYLKNNSKLDWFNGPPHLLLDYRVVTITGDYEDSGSNNCGTDGSVRIHIDFLTDLGLIHQNNLVLNNPGDDREEGGWDFYYFKLSPIINGNTADWVEISSAAIELKGKDGWYLKELAISAYKDDYTSLTSRPEMWLDNSTNNGWDLFHTNDSDTTDKTGRYHL